MESVEKDKGVLGDRALSNRSDDRLGFSELAQRLSKSLVEHRSDGGLVVGLEGRWGSGKSSLLFLIEEELRVLSEENRPIVINFKPWLVGNRDALLSGLFDDLAEGISQIRYSRGDATGITQRKIENTVKRIRDFSARFNPLLDLARMGSKWASLPFAPEIIESLQKLRKKGDNKPLAKLKNELRTALTELDHRFVVMIDDVDRLDPDELLEVLRLVRSVADFPNVIYILCYDSDIVAKSIERSAGVDDGHAYLEKIVQLAIMVPLPEAFQLRRWFAEELRKIALPKNEDEAQRLTTNIDRAGGIWLRTPRTVVRALDALRFHMAALQAEGCDLADAVWLAFIKDGNPKLYRWIEDYCLNASEMALGTAVIGEAENQKKLENLTAAVGDEHFADLHYQHDFCEHLLGVEIAYEKDSRSFTVYNRVNQQELNSAIAGRRLSSPDHFRHYFALSGPSFALTQTDYAAMWRAIDSSPDSFGALLLDWHAHMVGPTLSKADLLFDRFHSFNEELFTLDRIIAILIGFGNSMDNAYTLRPTDPFAYTSLWQRSFKLIKLLLTNLTDLQRSHLLTKLFQQGTAISWLSRVFRWEIIAHGRHGHRAKYEEDRILTALELDEITLIISDRYAAMSWRDIQNSADGQMILWTLKDIQDPKLFEEWVKQTTNSNDGFIELLEMLTGWVESSDKGRYKVLQSDSLKGFLDFGQVSNRLLDMATDEAAKHLLGRVNALQKAIDISKHF